MDERAPAVDTLPKPELRGLGHALAGTLILAGVATAAEAAWIVFGIRHTMTAGLIHGALIFMVAGAVLGAALDPERGQERSRASGAILGALGGILAGLAGAGIYYLLVGPLRRLGLGSLSTFAAYFAVWLFLGLILKVLGRVEISARNVVMRSLLAGVSAALGFFFVALLWSGRGGGPPLVYLLFFGAWASAFLPGFLALLLRRPEEA